MTPPKTVTKNPVGCPRTRLTPEQVGQRSSRADSWRQIGKALGIGTATAMRLLNQFLQAMIESRSNFQETHPPSLGDST
jgi:hypothetical protein